MHEDTFRRLLFSTSKRMGEIPQTCALFEYQIDHKDGITGRAIKGRKEKMDSMGVRLMEVCMIEENKGFTGLGR